jgi:hypothetical protein
MGRSLMPKPNPIPRKYKSDIDDAQDNLFDIARIVRKELNTLEAGRSSVSNLCNSLWKIVAQANETAYLLAQIDVTTDCTGCPLAPSTTRHQAFLLMLADTLEQLAAEMRQGARASTPNRWPGNCSDLEVDE